MGSILARRSLFGLATAAVACPVCAAAFGAETAHWGYEGGGGPAKWGDLSADFRACSAGVEQTPIDLVHPVRAELGSVTVAYQKMPLKIVNNGHTIQVKATPGSRLQINETAYELLQFHFHHPSEHLLAGKAFDLECHFVHRSAAGAFAVLGVFVQPGAANAALTPIWQAMPAKETPEQTVPGVTVDASALLPKDRHYFRYMGSLTTPPCSEGLTWTVFRDPVTASVEQIRAFAALFPMNARPSQPLNRRFLLTS
ncbi:MAG: carbonic anhydrase [Acetobacteraceae bacterium]